MRNPDFRLAEYQGKWYPQVRWHWFFGLIPCSWETPAYYPYDGHWSEVDIKYDDKDTYGVYGSTKEEAERTLERYIDWHNYQNKKDIVIFHKYIPKN